MIAEHWSNFMRHVIEEKTRFWEIDEITDRMIDEIPPLIILISSESNFNTDYSD